MDTGRVEPRSPRTCCASHTARWLVALIVCASLTLTCNTIILVLSSWSGPIYVSFQIVMVLCLVYVIVTASMTSCCWPGAYDRTAAYAALIFVVLALATIVTLASTTHQSAQHACSFEMKCEWKAEMGIEGKHCDSSRKEFTLCYKPKQATSGELYYSKLKDDCDQGGGDDKACRGFGSVQDCVDYLWPEDDHDDECSKSTSTITEQVRAVAIAVAVFLCLAIVPAAGAALAILGWSSPPPVPQEPVQPPLAHLVEIELGPRPPDARVGVVDEPVAKSIPY